MLEFITAILAQSKYFFIFLATPIGGPTLILASGVLLHEGVLELAPLFIAIALGELTQDTLWYVLGYRYGNRFIQSFGKYLSISPALFERTIALFAHHGPIIILGAKLTMGFFTMPIIVLSVAGAARVPFITYLFWNIVGEAVWLTSMLSIGYYLGELSDLIAEGFRLGFMIGIIAIVSLVIFGFSKFMRKQWNESHHSKN